MLAQVTDPLCAEMNRESNGRHADPENAHHVVPMDTYLISGRDDDACESRS